MPRPSLRLLFDENTSPRVARALTELGHPVTHIGGDDAPPKGTPDEDVLGHALATNKMILTENHDLIVICAEAGAPVVWLDPRDKDMTFTTQVLLCFTQIAQWDSLVTQHPDPLCVHARKTTCRAISLEEAKSLALSRGKRRRQKARRTTRAPQDARLLDVSPPSDSTSA